MSSDPVEWRLRSPGDLSCEWPAVRCGDLSAAVERSSLGYREWSRRSLSERQGALLAAKEALDSAREELALLIAGETGKPLAEARLELGAVVAKFDLTFGDAGRHVAEESVSDGPHPAAVRRLPRGPAAVIAPFNFPIHLGHGAAVAYLLAGNTVLFKPSPFATHTALAYAEKMQAALPAGVFEVVAGWGETGRALAMHPAVRSVCFTGSIPAGTALAQALAADYSKSLALELGGKNSVIVWEDADLPAAAAAVADGACLTAGQRCNATARVLVHEAVFEAFRDLLLESLRRYAPGDPLDETTKLGPVISEAAVARYRKLTSLPLGDWIRPPQVPESVHGKRGHFVEPAVLVSEDSTALDASELARTETFVPILVIERISSAAHAIQRHGAWPFGLSASVFCGTRATFDHIGSELHVGNLYWNLPTTFSPSTLPFGGWGTSGNGRPGGRGFIRFAVEEQAVQWKS